MSAVVMPVTFPGILAFPTPSKVPGLDCELKKLLLLVTVLVPNNAPVVAPAPVTAPEA